jgi:hypothetical protein
LVSQLSDGDGGTLIDPATSPSTRSLGAASPSLFVQAMASLAAPAAPQGGYAISAPLAATPLLIQVASAAAGAGWHGR